MKRVLAALSAAGFGLVVAGALSPASATIVNGGFETPPAGSPTSLSAGLVWSGASGWNSTGQTFQAIDGIYDNVPSGTNVAVLNTGTIMSQSVGVTISNGLTYTVNGQFGNRNDFAPTGGSFGFFAGSISNIIFEQTFAAPAVQGTLQNFVATFIGSNFAQFAGQTLGFFIRSTSSTPGVFSQLTVDNITGSAQIVTPVPGAVWLFGSVLAGGLAASRRRRQAI